MAHGNSLEAAVFDLGNVILDISPEHTLKTWAEATGIPPDVIEERFRYDAAYERLERGEISPAAYHRHLAGLIGHPITYEAFERGWNALIREVKEGIEPVLEWAERRLRLVVLTNTNAVNAEVWRARCAKVFARFEKVFVSYEMGARKPEPRCYRMVLDYLGTEPERVVFFDDVPENVAGAAAVGMQAFVVTRPDQIVTELTRLGLPADRY